jgi:hypothetical protein
MSGFTNDTFASKLGGGIPGGMPLGGLIGGGGSGGRNSSSGMEGGGEREMERLTLRRAVGNTTFPGGNPQIITPFRRFYNAGDTAGTKNSNASVLLGQPNQLSGNSMVSRIHASPDGMNTRGEAFYSGNQKYVYDSSNYVRFKKLQAVNRNYNDSSFGGNGGSTVFSTLGRVRR